MIAQLWKRATSLRRLLSRNEWSTNLLKLPKSEGTASETGLILIQIDGLSRAQFEQAIRKKEMPFLARLMRREEYELHSFYSGLPSSTPAVQGEIFYGIKGAVPTFSFRDHESGELRSMLSADSVAKVEAKLAAQGRGLLTGGTAYGDIYTAGAENAYFCAVRLGFDKIVRKARRIALVSVLLFYIPVSLRILGLMGLEFLIAFGDFFKGVIDGRGLCMELKFIPTRVAICILLRELVTTGVSMDALRGVPIIHCNFLGYDEQSHRRGPSSAFAHWALKGIDWKIRHIWRTARRSARRTYDIWIYSDHGQEATKPYVKETGKLLEAAVAEVLQRHEMLNHATLVGQNGIHLKRAGWLGRGFQWLLRDHPAEAFSDLDIPAMGPVGHIYLTEESEARALDAVAADLVGHAKIPCVLMAAGPEKAKAWTPEGVWNLPEDTGKVVGEDHPFLEEVRMDLMNLVHHPDSGTLLLLGYRPNGQPLTFPLEHGSHAGAGREEMHGFALFPADAPITLRHGAYLRGTDIFDSAQLLLGHKGLHRPHRFMRRPGKRETLRVMTYNTHSCLGMDGRIFPERIARVIARYSPDIVCLQEIDVRYMRTGGVDQAEAIAKDLEMEFHFHPAYNLAEEQYGDAILTSLPMKLVKAGALPAMPGLEPRGAIWTTINFHGKRVHLFNTHIGLRRLERARQVEALLGAEWLDHPECCDPVILCGDFNTLPMSPLYRKLTRRLNDVQTTLKDHRLRGTFLGLWRLDHIFVSPGIQIAGINIPRNALTRTASDHLPVIVDLVLQ